MKEGVCICAQHQRHLFANETTKTVVGYEEIHGRLPIALRWDIEYVSSRQSWTCTPFETHKTVSYPLTIAGAPVVLPVEHRWPPTGGVNPPPDPRSRRPIDCRASLDFDTIGDLQEVFEGSVGFYLLINGLLQVIVPSGFDTAWASSHLPHTFGGLRVSYIEQSLEPTMLPTETATTKVRSSLGLRSMSLSNRYLLSNSAPSLSTNSLELNDFIEARGKSIQKERYTGRIGLSVARDNAQYLTMSSHVIAEAILAKSLFGRGRSHPERLQDDWNLHADIWAGNTKIGIIEKTYDTEAGIYPNGFAHDVTLIKPISTASIQSAKSPVAGLGWLTSDAWSALRQQTSTVRILSSTETHREAKTLKCNLCSEVLVVGEGIFLNQTTVAGPNPAKEHDKSTWTKLVSRAVLYRVNPDFDPPNGYSGVALYANGLREDGTEGPGVVGFQSFVQRSGQVQNYAMEGSALEQRLSKGRIAFYGAFMVPEELRKHYTIL
ncbi:hypothetical protein C7974DRAFT_303401 [Boeremia exigua]|uniref:uncharacterized protein n=1 Tax=Boeremia exigua TaxID=749465 RepID=UPI001E8E211F|nr:uncharacterized protein C7974DRAFT_303401 [Boeremia exigua]KAH6642314.1 hypothetical protein C7974DRAFT_303401 [Boeremia exigua]